MASRGRGRDAARGIGEAARELGWEVVVRTTVRAGEEVELGAAAAREGWPLVLAAGGDGTVHGVANGVLDAGTDTVLAHVPIGTGNDFAKILGMRPGKAREGIRTALMKGVVRRLDVGRVLGEFFINGMGIGFDAEVVRQTLGVTRRKGFLLYLSAVYKTFWAFEPVNLEVMSEEHSETGRMMMLEISIGTSAGGGFKLTPTAVPDDGLFDVCIIREVSTAQFLRWVPRVIRGTHLGLDPVTLFQTSKVQVKGVDRPLAFHLDGELRLPDDDSVHVELLPGALPVVCAA